MVSHPAKFTDAKAALDYTLAGETLLSAVSKKTGGRLTFRVTKAPENAQFPFACWWVSLDSTSDKPYLGSFDADRKFWPDPKLGKLSEQGGGPAVEGARAIRWLMGILDEGRIPDTVELWHAGRCGRCGCELTTIESITRGLGPVCAVKVGAVVLPAPRAAKAVVTHAA